MSGNFREGDAVIVCMARNDCFPFQDSPRIAALITYTPSATGDCWRFKTNGGLLDGIPFLVNPQASDFIGLVAP